MAVRGHPKRDGSREGPAFILFLSVVLPHTYRDQYVCMTLQDGRMDVRVYVRMYVLMCIGIYRAYGYVTYVNTATT